MIRLKLNEYIKNTINYMKKVKNKQEERKKFLKNFALLF